MDTQFRPQVLTALAACVGIGIAIAVSRGARSASVPRPSSRMEALAAELLPSYPALAEHFAHGTYEEGFEEGARLVGPGLARLPDAELLTWARLRDRLLSGSDAECAALVGLGDADAAMAAIERLPDADLRAWSMVTLHAQALELAGGPRPVLAADAEATLDAGLARVRAGLVGAELARWDDVRAGRASSGADVCFVERAAVRAARGWPDAEAARFFRAMLEPPSAP